MHDMQNSICSKILNVDVFPFSIFDSGDMLVSGWLVKPKCYLALQVDTCFDT